MHCPKCGNRSVNVTWVRDEAGAQSHGVISCPLCGQDHYFTLPKPAPPRQGKGKVVKLPGAKRKKSPGYLAHGEWE
jgi:predicted nucleic-acid-binding Zn-ribbon protein